MRGPSFVLTIVLGAGIWSTSSLWSVGAHAATALSQGASPQGIVTSSVSTPLEEQLPPPPPPASFDDARFSLSLQNVSLPEMLRQVSLATSLQFRYAAPPDVMLSASFRNAPLFASLEKALQPEGFSLLRDGSDAWLLRAHPRPINALRVGASAPDGGNPQGKPMGQKPVNPRKVLSPQEPLPVLPPQPGTIASPDNAPPRETEATGAPESSKTQAAREVWGGDAVSVNAPFDGWDMRYEEASPAGKAPVGAPIGVRERHLALEADAREFPGVTVIVPDEMVATRVGSAVRYTLFLRHVPEHLRLALDTPRSASLKVNGATLRRAWSGLAEFELSGALRMGLNSIEVRWNPAKPEEGSGKNGPSSPTMQTTMTGQEEASQATDGAVHDKIMAKPLLRYEWLSGNQPASSEATLPLPGGFRLLLGQSPGRSGGETRP